VVVVAEVLVVMVVAEATFARDVARLFVTVCCDSVTVVDSAFVEAAFGFRPFFLGTSGGGVSCCELCSEADCAGSAEAAAAAVRRVERRVAVADIVLQARLVGAMRDRCGDLLGSCYAIARNGAMV